LKLSVVDHSTSMRAGRSARAQTTPELFDTSPDWRPWEMTGRSAARLRYGRPMPPSAVSAVVPTVVLRNFRRVGSRITGTLISSCAVIRFKQGLRDTGRSIKLEMKS
jgi:hypothetical protein